MKTDLHELAKNIIKEFMMHGISARIAYVSDWGSVYIEFDDAIEPIMIGKGIGNEKKKYRYNLRMDIEDLIHIKDMSHEVGWTYHYPIKMYVDLIMHIVNEYNRPISLKNQIRGRKL